MNGADIGAVADKWGGECWIACTWMIEREV